MNKKLTFTVTVLGTHTVPARHDKEIEDDEDELLRDMDAEAAVTARDWGDLD